MLPPGLLVVDDTGGSGQDNVSEGSGWQERRDKRLDLADGHVVSWGDAAGLVDSAQELDNDLAGSVVVNDLELANVAWSTDRKREEVSHCSATVQERAKGAKLWERRRGEMLCSILVAGR